MNKNSVESIEQFEEEVIEESISYSMEENNGNKLEKTLSKYLDQGQSIETARKTMFGPKIDNPKDNSLSVG